MPKITHRRRRSDAERRQVLARYRQSGLSPQQFCKQQGMGLATLRRWEKRLGEASESSFVELTPAPTQAEASPAPRWLAELELPNGLRLRIRG